MYIYKQGVAISKDCYYMYMYKVLKCLEIKHELLKIKLNQIVPFYGTCDNCQNSTYR